MIAPEEPSGRVLVLEDDPGIQYLVRRTLEKEGYIVFSASDHTEGRLHLAAEKVDILVLDYQLSGNENGLDFYRQVKGEGRNLPAILITGFSDESRILEALRAGLRDLIPKTPNFVELVPPTIERVLGQVKQEQRLKEAEAASRAKDNFLATLSHELRTPLTPVLALISHIREDERLPEDLRDDVDVIRRNVALEARLIDDLLDLTRISRGKLELRQEDVEIAPLIEHALHTARQGDLSSKQLRWRFELETTPVIAHVDSARITQVFWNLLKNSMKFTPEGGEITISSRKVETDGGPVLRVSVGDNGMGITAEALPKIFDAFEQGGRTITKTFGGLGLGLAISKALMDLHGGSITAESAGANRGATFVVEIPLASGFAVVKSVQPARESKGSEVQPQATHLLLVEDHPDTAAIMARMLRRAGFRVTQASKVQEALRRVDESAQATEEDPVPSPIEFVVSDLGLPDGSGVELMAQLRTTHGLRGIALSGYGMEEDIRRAEDAGFLKHLTKPVEFSNLLAALKEVLPTK